MSWDHGKLDHLELSGRFPERIRAIAKMANGFQDGELPDKGIGSQSRICSLYRIENKYVMWRSRQGKMACELLCLELGLKVRPGEGCGNYGRIQSRR
jgi:hypothetical protein